MSPTAHISPNPLLGRDIISDAGQTLSSWDSCMAVPYCKWPVIVAIIVGGLIVLSIITCIARFACCGLECCCWCCSCFNRCCPSPRGSKSKYSQAPQNQAPQTYGYHPGMFYGPPQFATFDAPTGGPKITEDSLPAMPSWQNAQTKHVEDTSYSSISDDGALNKETGGSDSIPMGAMRKSHEQEQYYEDPDDAHNPMLASQRTQDSYDHQQYSYQQQQQQAQQPRQFVDDNPYPYQDRSSYAATERTYPQQQDPSHPYGQYSQQQDTYSNAPVTPSSGYTSTYPPTYHSRTSTVRSFSRPMPRGSPYSNPPLSTSPPPNNYQYQNLSPTSPTGHRGADPTGYRPEPASYSYSPPPVEAPGSPGAAEMPGSLVPGGGQRYYPQQ